MNFTLCKNRCNYTKRNKQSRNPTLSVQPSQNCTIPCFAPSRLTYERSVGFASLQSPWAFNFGHPCPSLVKGEVLSPERIRATTGVIAFLPHPFRFSNTSVNNPSIVGSASHCNRSSPLHKGAKGDSALPTIPKPHYPSPCTTTLASLVKGEVLSPEKIRVTTGVIATPLLPKLHYPSPCTTTLASLVKGEVLSPS